MRKSALLALLSLALGTASESRAQEQQSFKTLMGKGYEIKETRVAASDLAATVFRYLGIDLETQWINPAGRPVAIVNNRPTNGRPHGHDNSAPSRAAACAGYGVRIRAMNASEKARPIVGVCIVAPCVSTRHLIAACVCVWPRTDLTRCPLCARYRGENGSDADTPEDRV